MLFAALTHLPEGVLLRALLKLKEDNFIICLVGTGAPTVFMIEWRSILPLKTLMRNKAWSYHRVEKKCYKI